MSRLYVRPFGLMWGEEADAAVEARKAGRLAGGIAAFSLAEIVSRDGATFKREILGFEDLARTKDPSIQHRLHLLQAPRRAIAGLSMAEPLIMGIINVTPDSFSDGGECASPYQAIAHGMKLAREGARIIDIGGESTRPGSEGISLDEERSRVIPVVRALAEAGLKVSIDTRKASIMREAAKAGAVMINDVSALQFDGEAPATAAQLKLPVCLMHARGEPRRMQDNPQYEDVVLDIFDALEALLERAQEAGLERGLLLADPGIGFGKTFRHNLEILRSFSIYHGLGVPLIFGASRKAFIGALTGERAGPERAAGSVGTALAAALQGAQVLRVHDVKATQQAVKAWRACVAPASSGL
jgi:dihydropteroate synthase